ncbi:hypothetical protein CEAn_00040 [Coxiella endosymbiont of Amblyomma nuttalli]|nr:hypothetical protein CEAn_00040 [Coxiella endosymbiont of Amblyomma nuttalli]
MLSLADITINDPHALLLFYWICSQTAGYHVYFDTTQIYLHELALIFRELTVVHQVHNKFVHS